MTTPNRPILRRWLKVAQALVLIGLAVILWQSFDGEEAWQLLLEADLRWVFAAIVVLTAQVVLSAMRWRLTASRLGISFSLAVAVREYYLAQFVNLSLPGGVLGDANRAYRSRQEQGFLRSGEAVVFERVAGQLGLLALFVVGFAWKVLSPEGLRWPTWLLSPVLWLLVGLALAVGGVLVSRWVRRKHENPLGRFAARFSHAVLHREVLAQQAFLSMMTAFCNVLAFALCALALGVVMAPIDMLTIVPLILLAMLIPIGIGGWGVREGAAAILFPVIGAASSAGLAVSVVFGLTIAASVIVGLLAIWIIDLTTPIPS